jgi:hypothetical protein
VDFKGLKIQDIEKSESKNQSSDIDLGLKSEKKEKKSRRINKRRDS